MDDIKELIKKSKKEEKNNAEFLYQLGLRFKNGDGTNADMFKAAKFFKKAGKLGHANAHLEHALFWWKTIKAYYYAEVYFKKAAELGVKEAEELLAEMKTEEMEKKNKKLKDKEDDGFFHCTNKNGPDLFEPLKFKDSSYRSFYKEHTFVRCPACRGEIECIGKSVDGELTKKVTTLYSYGTAIYHQTDVYEEPTVGGQTVIETFQCKNEDCEFGYSKKTQTKLEIRDAEFKFKDMFRDSYDTEWWRIETITYASGRTQTGKDLLNVLKKAGGKYEGKDN